MQRNLGTPALTPRTFTVLSPERRWQDKLPDGGVKQMQQGVDGVSLKRRTSDQRASLEVGY